MSDLQGKDFRARVRLSNKADTETFAMPGETCERVPASSLEGLLHSRKIEPIEASHTPTSAELEDLHRTTE